ncbi:hypothetical protein [Novosphingobium subterraneum]|uniref:Uncharacterized protein n=1 Tax=Novosphingobium subterraneum TaxID=48936 RepID=A0A0B8Z5U6_9SPHN|nr:hypothetical protein [Novosphingobium subterraneum]KHS41588.1 hypothetical protein NJ75_04669 [Novosphingobium subterraneum]
MGDETRTILEPDVAPVEAVTGCNELGVDVLAHRLAGEEAWHAGDVRRGQDAEHVVEEGLAHPREREAGEHGFARGGRQGCVSCGHRSHL